MNPRPAAAIVVLTVASWVPAGAQPVIDRTLPTLQTTEDAMVRRRLLGVLLFTPVTVDHDAVPAREAFQGLAKALGITIIGRYADDPLGYGMDPQAPITLQVDGLPAIDVLEAMLEQCSTPTDPCTWQLRKGFVEVGTKARLSVPAARELRLYDIVDLKMNIPSNPLERKRPEEGALEVVQLICETIEPGAWDYGQLAGQEPSAPTADGTPPTDRLLQRDKPNKSAPPSAEPKPSREHAPSTPADGHRYVAPKKIAIIRYWRDVLIVYAPDYIHRQINGYPEPIPPDHGEPGHTLGHRRH